MSIAVLAILAIYGTVYFTTQPSSQPSRKDKGLVIDQLGYFYPNESLVSRTVATLTEKGYQVDLYRGAEVTVALLKSLPWHEYKFVIFRTHSSIVKNSEGPTGDLAIYTAEPYSTDKYTYEQLTDQLVRATPSTLGAPDTRYYFAVTSEFVRQSIHDRLDGTEVLLMGCDGMRTDALSKSFEQKGATVFVSWNGLTPIPKIDSAMGMLVEKIAQHGTLDGSGFQQVASVMRLDTSDNSQLECYPCNG